MFVVASASGCVVAPSKQAQTVVVSTKSQIAAMRCDDLGQVEGYSAFGSCCKSTGIPNAQSDARENAAFIGGTHLYWTRTTFSPGSHVFAQVFRCL